MKTNLKIEYPAGGAPLGGPVTHEGAPAYALDAEKALRRSVMACMLWEDTFYEAGQDIAARIDSLVWLTDPARAAAIAIEARSAMKLRHAPLHIVRAMARRPSHRALVGATLEAVIQRADEIAEFLALYWKDGRQPLAKQVKKGLAAAFRKFSEYNLAKYDRDAAVKLRDALFLSHAKPVDGRAGYTKTARQEERRLAATPELAPGEALYRKIAERSLAVPDTWEVALSGGADKRETFARLMADRKLGALATLRNIRNMAEAGIPKDDVAAYLASIDLGRVLPFRFVAAARAYPQWEDVIEPAMLRCLDGQDKWPGTTILLVDVSGSMMAPVSRKADLMRLDAACALAILLREVCADVRIATFSNQTVMVPPRRGFALRDAIVDSQSHGGTMLGQAIRDLAPLPRQRIIVVTDEQSHDAVGPPQGAGWVINVAAYQNGVGYGAWNHVDGWSETLIDYIQAFEADVAIHGE